jgi:hypothetical protein
MKGCAVHIKVLLISTAILCAAFIINVDSNRRAVIDLGGRRFQPPDLCIFKMVSGFDCPGCGISRSIVETVHLRLRSALDFHLLGPLALLVIVLQIPYRIMLIALGWNPIEKWVSWIWTRLPPFVIVLLLAPWSMKFAVQLHERVDKGLYSRILEIVSVFI